MGIGASVAKHNIKSSAEQEVNERDLEKEQEKELSGRDNPFAFKKALVVDDSKFNRRMLGKTIQCYFAQIDHAEDGLQAIELVKESMNAGAAYDIIFMDSIMPNMDGIEATAKIRELGFKNMIIGITGTIINDEVERFQAAGAHDVLLKPLLLSHVESILIDLQATKEKPNLTNLAVAQKPSNATLTTCHSVESSLRFTSVI